MEFRVLLEREAISARISVSTKRQALAAIADLAAERLKIDSDMVLDALLEREELGSTGVGHGVAVPHARLDRLDRMSGVFVRLETPVPFASVDDRPVDLLFALFAPKDAGVEHLQALAKVSRLLRNKELREQLRKARTADAIYALLVRQAEPTAA
jgi:PTS system nitrogen regulatory IIA component